MWIPSYFIGNSELDPYWKDHSKQNKNHLHRKLIHNTPVFTARAMQYFVIFLSHRNNFHVLNYQLQVNSEISLLATAWKWWSTFDLKRLADLCSDMPLCLTSFFFKTQASFSNVPALCICFEAFILYQKYLENKMTGNIKKNRKKLYSYFKKSGLAARSGKCQRVCGINSIWQA